MADRQELHDKHPDSWVPVNAGDILIGRVTDVVDSYSDQRNNQKGGYYPLLTISEISQADGYADSVTTLKVHCFGTVLFNQVMRKQPEVGERVKFTYRGQGEVKKRGQNPPELYSVEVAGRKDAGARAYGKIETAEAAPAAPVTSPAASQPASDPAAGVNVQQEFSDDDIPF